MPIFLYQTMEFCKHANFLISDIHIKQIFQCACAIRPWIFHFFSGCAKDHKKVMDDINVLDTSITLYRENL